MYLRLAFYAFVCLVSLHTAAQDRSKAKFGKITPEDFKPKAYSIDSSANAVVIADIGTSEVVSNSKAGLSLEFKKFRRVHILNKNGNDQASVGIWIYSEDSREEELRSLKAVTYNLENGKIVESKLDAKTAVFREPINKKWTLRKFTFPNVKEGSIIEYEYTLRSDFIRNLQSWDFQDTYPTLWSEYTVSIPDFYNYVMLKQGYLPFFIQEMKEKREIFTINDTKAGYIDQGTGFSALVKEYRWAMKDVPAMREEAYTSTVRNHLARIEFQLAELRKPYVQRSMLTTWTEAATNLLKSEGFGYYLNVEKDWLNEVMPAATRGATDQLEKARNIFAYIRDNITCTNYNWQSMEKPLRAVLNARSGNVAEINLLLTAMLLKEGLLADPVILSTRSHGYTYEQYPMLNRFNYVITRFELNGKIYYLDASRPRLGFGKLGYDAYNGHARVINDKATPLEFLSDSLVEGSVTSVFIVNGEKGNLTGSLQKVPGYYESYDLRNRVKEKGKDNLLNEFRSAFAADVDISAPAIDSLDKYDEPLAIRYSFSLRTGNEDLFYFNPMCGEGYKDNPFKSAERSYPVEMPYTIDRTFSIKLDIPAGYTVDEMPKPIAVKLNEKNDGFFEYKISQSNGSISMRTRVKIKRAFFRPDEYEMLREFFNLIVKKQSEQIVFKKKS